MKYYVEDITFKNGTTRTDGRYPKRIGSTIELKSDLKVGFPLWFHYYKYNNGELAYQNITCTSCVDDFDLYSKPGYLFVYTRNSIYTLKEVNLLDSQASKTE